MKARPVHSERSSFSASAKARNIRDFTARRPVASCASTWNPRLNLRLVHFRHVQPTKPLCFLTNHLSCSVMSSGSPHLPMSPLR